MSTKPLEMRSVVWRLLLSVGATGFYDTLKTFLEGDFSQESVATGATALVAGLLMAVFHKGTL